MPNPFATLNLNDPTQRSLALPASDHFAAGYHRWAQMELDALAAALAAQRPLLVRGEPGCGKSQLARAAAVMLGGPEAVPLVEVIHPRFEALDLKYQFDAVMRLADAQANDQARVANLANYVKPGKLWQAMAHCQAGQPRPVLLIDEIDKADADVPNALLDVLGNRSLHNPLTEDRISADGRPMPLILLTTNEERELPAAFVRRCLVLNLNPPRNETAFLNWLKERASAHDDFQTMATEVLEAAARKVWADREAARLLAQQTVGLAEYIDLLTALRELTQGLPSAAERKRKQLEWLSRLARYFLVKGADMPAAQADVEPAAQTSSTPDDVFDDAPDEAANSVPTVQAQADEDAAVKPAPEVASKAASKTARKVVTRAATKTATKRATKASEKAAPKAAAKARQSSAG